MITVSQIARDVIADLFDTRGVPYHGKAEEVAFLEPLFDLEGLPSTDTRFQTAARDIQQHRINNDDWENQWIFKDERFLAGASDKMFLDFLCACLSPRAKHNTEDVKYLAHHVNEALFDDGWQLYVKRRQAGMPVYAARQIPYHNSEIGTDFGPYRYIKKIDEGYFAVVSKYRDLENSEEVAVKDLKTEHLQSEAMVRRFKTEIECMEKLNGHENIVPLSDHGRTANRYWYIMPVADQNLSTFDGRTPAEKRHVFLQILRGVEHAHENGVLHRDLAPSNILLSNGPTPSDPLVWVADFGLGRDSSQDGSRTVSDVTGMGHSSYKAPEQDRDLKTATEQSDIYSLGRILSFLFSGFDPAHHVDVEFRQVILRATQRDPKDRYESVQELRHHFDKVYSLIHGTLVPSDILDAEDLREFINGADRPLNAIVGFALANIGDTALDYHSFSEPVVEMLCDIKISKKGWLEQEPGISRVVRCLVDSFVSNSGKIGITWSHQGRLFANLVRTACQHTQDEDLLAHCICELWRWAYDMDQWNMQSTANEVLAMSLPRSVEVQVATFIQEAGTTERPAMRNISPNTSELIKRAIRLGTKGR